MTSTSNVASTKAVMVLDDESDIVFIFRKSLDLAGYGVFQFTDPLLALDHLQNNAERYGLIISDVRMPGMSGIEFAGKVRVISRSIPIILMSAFNMADLNIPPELNVTTLLQKPVTPIQLREMVSSFISLPSRDGTSGSTVAYSS